MCKVEDTIRQKRVEIEDDNDDKIAALREKLDAELQETQDDMEKKHAYKLEQLRQDLMDKHETVFSIESNWKRSNSFYIRAML